MTTPITNGIFADFLECKHKAYLKFTKHSGTKSEFENIQIEQSQEYRRHAWQHLLKRYGEAEGRRHNLPLSEMLQHQYPMATDVYLVKDGISVNFDALLHDKDSSVATRSTYIPVIFVHHEKINKNNKLLLAFCG